MSAGWPEEPFWRFSLDLYGRPGVEEAVLHLQDRRGLDVNLVLLGCWLGTQGQALGPDQMADLRDAVADWRARAILPLRAVRRALKDPGLAPADLAGPVARLRAAVQTSELDAEHLEQIVLARGVAGLNATGRAGPGCTAGNLALLGSFDQHDRAALRCLLERTHPEAAAADIEEALRRLAGEA